MKQQIKLTSKFRRSIDELAKYYRNMNPKDKLIETIMISDLCMKLADARRRVKSYGK